MVFSFSKAMIYILLKGGGGIKGGGGMERDPSIIYYIRIS